MRLMVVGQVYVALILVAVGIGLAVAAWLWEDHLDLPARLFVALVALYSLMGLLLVAELLAPSRALSTALYGMHSAVGSFGPLLWILFVLEYTGYLRRIPRRLLVAVVGWYVFVAVLQATNPVHGLVWTGYEFQPSPVRYAQGTPTTLAVVLLFPQSLLYYGGVALLGAHLLFGSGVGRRQTVALLAGNVPAAAVLTAWFAGVLPGPVNGAMVITAPVLFGAVSWAVTRHQLFDVAPLARETAFEALDDPVAVVDADRRLLDYNRAAADTFPSLSDTEGQPIEECFPELVPGRDAGAGEVVALEEVEETEVADASDDGVAPVEVLDADDESEADIVTPFAESFTRYGPDGLREYAVSVSPLRVRGSIAGYTLVLRDVTERRQHVRDLEQQTAQLERFASTLSHDLRNPLNVAQGWVDMAQSRDEEVPLDKASDALDRIEQIVDDTLTLAREGQAIEEREQVSLRSLARDAWATTDTGDATLAFDPGAGTRLYADPTRLRSAFENLFRNAVEHGSTSPRSQAREDAVEHAGPDVTVRVGRTDDGFYVADDGPGVPPDERESVFEYEYSTADDGTGLGLAIVDAIARAHGWNVAMTESDDGGAKVVFSGVDVVDVPESSGDSAAITDADPADADWADAVGTDEDRAEAERAPADATSDPHGEPSE